MKKLKWPMNAELLCVKSKGKLFEEGKYYQIGELKDENEGVSNIFEYIEKLKPDYILKPITVPAIFYREYNDVRETETFDCEVELATRKIFVHLDDVLSDKRILETQWVEFYDGYSFVKKQVLLLDETTITDILFDGDLCWIEKEVL